ncbi:MAG: glutamate-cysteine ligase family protein [Gemmatimonadota bacterium]|nr:glutamate-cysteine ligase family protein [Gemmatimonadota bacterium]
MGTQTVNTTATPEQLRAFTAQLLEDLDRLKGLLESDGIEKGPTRIGAELEMFLVDRRFRPVRSGPQILERIQDARVTPELGAFNLEINSTPSELAGPSLSGLENQLLEVLSSVREAAAELDVRVALAGILPTLEARHASLDYMTPSDRYVRLNDAMTALRGGAYSVFIKGVDELALKHETVMLEACNTSFQLHLQVDPARFAMVYNIGLLATAPVLAISTNSPLLFGRRLWRETRIALFQQSIDTRRPTSDQRFSAPRVDFGRDWVENSVLDIYRDDVARFRAVLSAETEADPPDRIPKLPALQLFNGTVYRWLRPCYGVAGDTAHLRIESRILPAGPTPVDQVANAAFWYGLLFGLEEAIGDPKGQIDFDRVRENFFAAARHGLSAPIEWIDGSHRGARELILEELLPIAARGLELAGVDASDSQRYLEVVRARAESRQTGSEWMLRAVEAIGGDPVAPWAQLTEAMIERQAENRPVHEWDLPRKQRRSIEERLDRPLVSHMQRDLVTAQETDPVSFALHLMGWKQIRHLPIEDTDQRLVGLITRSTLFRYLAASEEGGSSERAQLIPLSEVMHRDLITAGPDVSVGDAILTMRSHGVSSLPIVDDGRLVGLVTERDFLTLATDALFGRGQGAATTSGRRRPPDE